MGNTRGKKSQKRGRLVWKKCKANRGRKPGMGKRKGMATWPEVRATMQRTATKIVVPAKSEDAKTDS